MLVSRETDRVPLVDGNSENVPYRHLDRQVLFLPAGWEPAGFFDRLVARAGGFFGVAFRGARAALRERLGLVLSRGSAIVSVEICSTLDRSSSACSSDSNRSSASTGSVFGVSKRPASG